MPPFSLATTSTLASPSPSVTAVSPLAKRTPAPLAGPVNVTRTPLIAFPNRSVTLTTNGTANAVSSSSAAAAQPAFPLR
jgi:hypothetical protein